MWNWTSINTGEFDGEVESIAIATVQDAQTTIASVQGV